MCICLARPCTNRYNETIMVRIIKIVVFSMFLLLASGSDGTAQNMPNNTAVFKPIKSQMTAQNQENIALVKENKKLRAQLIGLQLESERIEREIRRLDPDYRVNRKFVREQSGVFLVQSDELKALDEDSLIREAQEIYLSGQSLDLNLVQKLRELRLYDLQFQIQELRLDYRELENKSGEIDSKHSEALQVIQSRIDQNSKREKDLLRRKVDLQEAAMTYPQEFSLLEMEIEGLKEKIYQLRTALSR